MPEAAPLASLLRNLAATIAEGGGGPFQTARGLAPGLGTPHSTLASTLRRTPLLRILRERKAYRPLKEIAAETELASSLLAERAKEHRGYSPLVFRGVEPESLYSGLYKSLPRSPQDPAHAANAIRYFADNPTIGGAYMGYHGGPIAVRGLDPFGTTARHEVSHALTDYLSRLREPPAGWLDRARGRVGSARRWVGSGLGASAGMLDEMIATASGGRSSAEAADLLRRLGAYNFESYLKDNLMPPGGYRQFFEGPVRFTLLSEPSSLTRSPESLSVILGRLADEAQKRGLAVGGLGLGGLGLGGLAAE